MLKKERLKRGTHITALGSDSPGKQELDHGIFKKADLINVYSKFLSDRIEEIGIENLPTKYQETAQAKIVSEEDLLLGKVKYNDKILHQSKIIKFYLEDEDEKKIQKDIDRIFRKISKNRKYFYSAKDLALIDALLKFTQNFKCWKF